MVVVMIVVYVGTFALAVWTLVAALRWPLVRGKHILCAALAVELAGRVVGAISLLIFVRMQAPGIRVFEVTQVLSNLSQVLGALLLLLFVLIMGAELRGRLVGEE